MIRTTIRRQPLAVYLPRLAINPVRGYGIKMTDGTEIDESSIDALTASEYDEESNTYLEMIYDHLETLAEERAEIEADLNLGVLQFDLPPNGLYFIHKQPLNKQIWLLSPITGPKRYDSINGKWTTLRDGTTLTELLEDEFGKALGVEFKFESSDH